MKKIWSFILAIAMMMSMAQFSAFADEPSTMKYVVMNIPYSDFYKEEKADEQQTTSNADAISTATTDKFKQSTGLAKGTYHNETAIVGVSYPVAMTESDYNALATSKVESVEKLGDAANYSFTDFSGTPNAYKTLTYSNGTYSFSAITEMDGKTNDSSKLGITGYTPESNYGDYQLELNGVTTNGKVNGEDAVVYGVILTTSDNKSYALYQLDGMWMPSRSVSNVKLAWSVKGGQGLKRGHGSGDPFYQYDMNGKTLTNVRVLTDNGYYDIACDQKLDEYYTGDEKVSASFADINNINVTAPTAFKDVKVSVSYSVGRQKTDVVKDAAITNGKVAVSGITCGTNYTVKVSSSNYAPVSVPATFATAHTPAAAVPENNVAPTCTKEGSYDEVVYCSVCNAEISRDKKTVAKLAHTPAAAVQENTVAATYAKEGSYDEVVYCSVCKGEISRNTVKIAKLATGSKKNTLNVSPTSKTLKVKSLAKKAQTIKIKVSKAQGTVEYTVSNSNYLSVKGNKVTVAKNTPKGKYTVKVTAAGNAKYKAATKTVKITVK